MIKVQEWLLSWNYPIDFSLNDTFSIERNTDGFWDRIGTTSLITFNDTITFCGKNTYYQIRYNNGHGCDYISNQAHDFFTDFIAPVTARLDTVSINTLTSKTEIGWERSPSQDTYGYIVYFFKDNIWVILDTLYVELKILFIVTRKTQQLLALKNIALLHLTLV